MKNDLLIITDTSDPVFQRSIGAYQVAHHARKHGYNTQVIDFASMFDPDDLESIIVKCVSDRTLAIGVSTTFISFDKEPVITDPKLGDPKTKLFSSRKYVSFPYDISNILIRIKEKFPNIKIMAGGANSYRIKDDALVDVVFHGYSEQSVIQYLNGLRTGNKRIWPKTGNLINIDGSTEHFDIENLDHFWHRTDCVLPKETLPIEISRGCIFKCKFCSYPLNGKKKFDYIRDPIRIRDEMMKNYELYGTTNYFFTDDTFNDSTHKLEALHKVITALPFKINFVSYLRVDLLYAHPEQIQLLYEMGLGAAFFGIETLNPKTGSIIGKGMNPETFKKFVVDLHDNHWKKEIPITCTFIIGLPKESIESVQATFDWCNTAPITSMFFPLLLKEDSHFQSEFDINFEKYGYVKYKEQDPNIEHVAQIVDMWSNEYMDSTTAEKLSAKFNTERFEDPGNNKLGAFPFFAMLNHGYPIEELRNMYYKDFTPMSILRKKVKLFKIYKEKLLQVLDNPSE